MEALNEDVNQEEKETGTGPGGVIGGAIGEKKDDGEANKNRANRKSGYRKAVGNIFDNIKGAIRGNVKDIFVLKIKLVVFGVIFALVIAALIVQGIVNSTSDIAKDSVDSVMSGNSSNGSTDASIEYENSGSLIYATEEQLNEISKDFLEEMETKYEDFFEAFSIKYSGKNSSTVANRIEHITTNYDSNEVTTVDRIQEGVEKVAGAVSLADERNIFEHILRAEKYNFNNILWRSFVQTPNGIQQADIDFKVDGETGLKYPVEDSSSSDGTQQDLGFFVTKTRSYLQTWHMPFDMITGTIDSQSDASLNTKLAYEIMASAYNEIVLDRYKVRSLTRTTKYRVYEETIQTKTVTTICGEYPDDQGGSIEECKDTESTNTTSRVIIEEIAPVKEDSTYRWDYVISSAKLFDNAVVSEYEFNPYYEYSTNKYNTFINANGISSLEEAKNKVEEYANSEEDYSRADGFSHVANDYYVTNTTTNSEIGVAPKDDRYLYTSLVTTTTTTVTKQGYEYEDIYAWNDKLHYFGNKSGIYNVESVKDVTGDDLTSSDLSYYNGLYYDKEINLIDLMNSDKDIYSNYLSSDSISTTTNNIGIRKDALDMSYSVLKRDLTEITEEHPLNSLRYGSSLGINLNSFSILSGLNFGDMENIAAGNLEGMNVAYPIAQEELANSYLQIGTKYGNSYGYAGHTGIDISYAYSAADKSLCSDYTNAVCPYIKGPGIYVAMDGTIEEVGYSAYNKYYKVGPYVGRTEEDNLIISDTSGWGTYVKIKNIDGTYSIYSHLFPDKEFFKQMSENIGQTINAGTFIGYMGNTGNSSGLHLHIEFSQAKRSLGGKTGNSVLTYAYLQKIINVMGISPKIS